MPISLSTSDILAGLALVVSGISAWKTIKFNDQQKAMMEAQDALNKRLLAREDADAAEGKRAELGADFFKVGSSDYRLKIYNKGKSAARDVQIDFPEGNDVVDESDVEIKFPLKVLERHQSVELIVSFHMDSKSTHPLRLRWADDAKADNVKMFYPVR